MSSASQFVTDVCAEMEALDAEIKALPTNPPNLWLNGILGGIQPGEGLLARLRPMVDVKGGEASETQTEASSDDADSDDEDEDPEALQGSKRAMTGEDEDDEHGNIEALQVRKRAKMTELDRDDPSKAGRVGESQELNALMTSEVDSVSLAMILDVLR